MAENESEGVGGARSLGDQGADAAAHRGTKTACSGLGWMDGGAEGVEGQKSVFA